MASRVGLKAYFFDSYYNYEIITNNFKIKYCFFLIIFYINTLYTLYKY